MYISNKKACWPPSDSASRAMPEEQGQHRSLMERILGMQWRMQRDKNRQVLQVIASECEAMKADLANCAATAKEALCVWREARVDLREAGVDLREIEQKLDQLEARVGKPNMAAFYTQRLTSLIAMSFVFMKSYRYFG